MEEALRFFRALDVWIYLGLALLGAYALRKMILAWQELRGAAFGLERESAQQRLNRSASALVLMLAAAIVEFVLVSYIAPAVPGVFALATPTIDLLATATTTLPAIATEPAAAVLTLTPTGEQAGVSGCLPGQIEITQPIEGADISASITISGTANIPNFGFYKLEMKRPEESSWLTILAGNEVKQNGNLGVWNTSLLPAGLHQLSLVVVDNQGQSKPPCVVQVRIINEQTSP